MGHARNALSSELLGLLEPECADPLHHRRYRRERSGTRRAIRWRTIAVSSSDAPTETVTLVHEVRDRAVFAHGALEAARWLKGRQGWFAMSDMLNATNN